MRRLVILPTYNEAANLEAIVQAMLQQGDLDVLVVDDNSPDGTGQRADSLSARYPERVHTLHRASKEGLGRAYAAGYAAALGAGYDVILQMDADFSHDPAMLMRLAEAIEAGIDVAIGSRYVAGGQTPGWPRRRRLLSRLGSRYAAMVLGLPVRDVTGGFKAFSRQALELVGPTSLRAAGFGVQIETTYQAYRHGLTVREIPITFHDRRAGVSKMSRAIIVEAFLLPWRLRLAHAALPGPYVIANPAYPVELRDKGVTGGETVST